jgi:hypothetical protein
MNQLEPVSPEEASLPSVSGALSFIKPQDTKPIFHSSALTGGDPKIFFELEERDVAVADMRPIAGELSIDKQGFELITRPTAVDDLYDVAAVEEAYYSEIKVMLRDRFGASQVEVFDATRRSDSESGVIAAGARILQINVWRPINGPVKRSPLALADASSIATDELVATDQIFPDRVGEIYQVAHGARQRWYYASEMARDEVLLIKGWDSVDDGRAHFTPHGAFDLPNSAGAPPRESIEIRTFVVIE